MKKLAEKFSRTFFRKFKEKPENHDISIHLPPCIFITFLENKYSIVGKSDDPGMPIGRCCLVGMTALLWQGAGLLQSGNTAKWQGILKSPGKPGNVRENDESVTEKVSSRYYTIPECVTTNFAGKCFKFNLNHVPSIPQL